MRKHYLYTLCAALMVAYGIASLLFSGFVLYLICAYLIY